MEIFSRISRLLVCFIGPAIFFKLFPFISEISKNILVLLGSPDNPSYQYLLIDLVYMYLAKMSYDAMRYFETDSVHLSAILYSITTLILATAIIGILVSTVLFIHSL